MQCLFQNISYRATSPSNEVKEQNSAIAGISSRSLRTHEKHDFFMNLNIPENIIIPNFSNCNLFKVDYTFKVGPLESLHELFI